MADLPYGQGFNQNYGLPGLNPNAMHPSLQAPQNNPNQSLQQQQMNQRAYQLRIQQAQQQAQLSASQGRPMSGGMNPMATPIGQMPNPQMARQIPQNANRQPNQEDFLKQIQQYMGQRGLPFDPNPVVSGRQINLTQLWVLVVVKSGGSAKMTTIESWSRVAQAMSFPPMQYPTAAQEIQGQFRRNLAAFETHFLQRQRERERLMLEQRNRQNNDGTGMQNQMSPGKQPNQQIRDQSPLQQQQNSQDGANSMKSMPPVPNNVHPASMNGFTTPQANRQTKQPNPYNQQRTSISRPPEPVPQTPSQGPYQNQSPAPPGKRASSTTDRELQGADQTSQMFQMTPIEDPFKPMILPESRFHGPIIIDEMFQLTNEIQRLKPTVPTLMELGIIDIHALNMSIKSGIHAEVRVALDTLATISVDHTAHVELTHCDDLVESLVDCAEDQVEFLAEYAAEVSDVMLISSYEDVVRGANAEIESVQDVPAIGTVEYDLDKSVDRLICITTILRNFSFHERNHETLVMPIVVKFMATVIRYLGTRNMLLRTHRNMLDFMKDVVTFLSNLSQSIILPGKEEALCLLHFLLSFAPPLPPVTPGKDILFSYYNPNIHKYTPPAIDSLAKLLARDEPNRTYYKAIFAADSASNPAFDLLTRTFALAIAPLPDPHRKSINRGIIPLVEQRKPFLLQGLLAAEILANLAPGVDTGVTYSWLASSDGFAPCLLRVVNLLATDRTGWAPPVQPRGGRPAEPEHTHIEIRGLAVLQKLAEKAKNPDAPNGGFPAGIFPTKVNLMGALGFKDIDPHFLRRLFAYAALED
jgi:SWI/SNF chromatin-remodeling complex subunit SWI1